MRKFLTLKVSTYFWMLVGLLSFGSVANGQNYYITVESGPLQGETMRVGIAAYRDFCADGIPSGTFTAQVANPILAGEDGQATKLIDLDPITADVGICQRGGGINFDTKAQNIKNAGGQAMLLINNDQANPNTAVNYGSAGAVADFWGISVSYNDGQRILADPTDFSFSIFVETPPETDVVIWEGQGEFDGGLAPFTTVGLACGDAGQDPALAVWNWTANGYTEGLYGGAKINSVSVCNGAAFFNSDLYDTNLSASGNGPCLANQNGELISPIIDLSALPEETALTLKFTQMTRQYQSNYFVGWSEDGGATWNEVEINTGLPVNSGYENSIQRIKLTGAKPTANFQIKFRYEGNYYFWIVDDVKLVEPEDYNALIDPSWMTTAPYPTMPLSQAVPVQFMTDVHNIGGKALSGVTLTAKITDEGGNEVYSASTSPTSAGAEEGIVNPGDTIQNIIFGSYLPTAVGNYTITYNVTTNEEDFDESNNTYSKTFAVTQANTGEWGREDGSTRNISLSFNAGVRIDWIYANVFRGEKAGDFAKQVRTGIANADDLGEVGGTVYVYIYECEDANGDFIFDDTEHDLVGYNYHDFATGAPAAWEDYLKILDFNTDEEISLEIKEGKWYIVGLVYQAPESAPSTYCYWLASDKVNQRATEYIGEQQGDYVCTHFLTNPWVLDGSFNLSSSRSLFTGTPVPFARFSLGTTGNKDLKLAENTFRLFPTNASDNVSVAFNFDNATDATMEVFDVKGNRVYNKKLENQKDQTNVVNVGGFSQGAYFVRVTTPNGSLSKPFNVIK